MAWDQICIVVLYVLSGALPLAGFARAFISHKRWVRYEQQRSEHIRRIDAEFRERWERSPSEEEQQAAVAWQRAENAKPDPRGKPYGDRGGLTFDDGTATRRHERYAQLKLEVQFVGAGVVCGSAASIWAVFAA